jgi:hypothetical protein
MPKFFLPLIAVLSLTLAGAAKANSYGPSYGYEPLPDFGAIATTPDQAAAWTRGDTYEKVQGLIYKHASAYCSNTVTDDECYRWTVDAYREGCISASMWYLFRDRTYKVAESESSTYFYHPECTPKRTFLQPCKCGCMISGTKVLAWLNDEEKWEEINKLAELKADLISLASPFNGYNEFERIRTSAAYVTSPNPEKERRVIEIRARLIDAADAETRSIILTPDHPLLLADGRFRPADELLMTDILLNHEGREMEVIGKEERVYRGSVFNADTMNESHVIFAEHFAIGDLYMQGIVDRERARLQERQLE